MDSDAERTRMLVCLDRCSLCSVLEECVSQGSSPSDVLLLFSRTIIMSEAYPEDDGQLNILVSNMSAYLCASLGAFCGGP